MGILLNGLRKAFGAPATQEEQWMNDYHDSTQASSDAAEVALNHADDTLMNRNVQQGAQIQGSADAIQAAPTQNYSNEGLVATQAAATQDNRDPRQIEWERKAAEFRKANAGVLPDKAAPAPVAAQAQQAQQAQQAAQVQQVQQVQQAQRPPPIKILPEIQLSSSRDDNGRLVVNDSLSALRSKLRQTRGY